MYAIQNVKPTILLQKQLSNENLVQCTLRVAGMVLPLLLWFNDEQDASIFNQISPINYSLQILQLNKMF